MLVISHQTLITPQIWPHITVDVSNNYVDIILDDTKMSDDLKLVQYKALSHIVSKLPNNSVIDIILKSQGGNYFDCIQACKHLKFHYTRVFVYEYAYSCGSILSLSADELHLTLGAKLSAINPVITFTLSKVTLQYDNGRYKIKNWDLEMDTLVKEQIGSALAGLKQVINPRYNQEKIIDSMFHSIQSHNTEFSFAELKEITDNGVFKIGE